MQEVVSLLLVDILTGLVADVGLQVLQVDLTVDDLHQVEESLLHQFLLQQLHLFLHREGHVRADEVQGHDIVGDVLDGKRGLVGDFLADLDVFLHLFAQVAGGRLEFTVVFLGLYLLQRAHLELQIGGAFQHTLDFHTALSLYDGGDVTVRQCQRLHHFGKDTHLIQVGLHGDVHFGVTLCHHADGDMLLLGLVDQQFARLAANQYR